MWPPLQAFVVCTNKMTEPAASSNILNISNVCSMQSMQSISSDTNVNYANSMLLTHVEVIMINAGLNIFYYWMFAFFTRKRRSVQRNRSVSFKEYWIFIQHIRTMVKAIPWFFQEFFLQLKKIRTNISGECSNFLCILPKVSCFKTMFGKLLENSGTICSVPKAFRVFHDIF